MRAPERTRQQLDPASTAGVQLVTRALCAGAFGFALVMSLRSLDQISHPKLAFVALAFLTIGCVFVLFASEPLRSPFTRASHYFALAVVLLAAIAESLSQLGSNTYVLDDWGPLTVGLILVAISPYRPAGEIASAGVIAAIFMGFLVLIEIPSFSTNAPAIAFIIVAITPIIALTAAASVFSHSLMKAIERWQRRMRTESLTIEHEFREGIARSVQQDRITILSRDVLPFFTHVLETGQIDDGARIRARKIGDSIRLVMVSEVDRSWLDNVMELAASDATRGSRSSTIVSEDPSHVAAEMSTDQRTALRALLATLLDVGAYQRKNLRIELNRDDTVCRVRIAADLDLNDYAMRSSFAPYFAVMRAVFTELEVQFVQPNLILRFSYEHQ